ncbi:FHA domain-containing protein [Ktedonospora formicarum]|uniref:ABC transporter ATP-binding protein n=1 Tax=Ktedonospora formicarum TaxID=2778364 RepID=A0A8J3MPB3_9CHLR|nr:FHA domain-containing protein [Ktedonospora formicarum]GHO43647.1 hypothetical protein KSX_18100 [Ktedonospora formicarum]
MINSASSPPSYGSIKFVSGPLNGQVFPITRSSIDLGREGGNDIIIPDPKVSRRHARIFWDNGNWLVENLSRSSNILLNQNKVQRGTLVLNSNVTLGEDSTFTVISLQAPPAQGTAGTPLVLSAQPAATPVPPVPTPPIAPIAGSVPPSSAPMQAPFGGVPPQASMGGIPPQAPMGGVPPIAPMGSAPPASQGLPGSGDRTAIAGMPSIEISSNIQYGTLKQPLLKPVINIGRNPACDIVVNEPVVSAFHAQIVREGNDWVLIHPHPSRGRTLNGLLYQGRIIRGEEQFRKPLVHGDIFRIGDEHGTLVTLTYDNGSGASQEQPPEIHPIPLNAPVITIGRAPNNMVVLNHPLISAYHARVEQGPNNTHRAIDLNSTNHTYVNGQRVSQQALRAGDEIRIGPYRLTYTGTQLTQYDESTSIRIDALNLVKHGNNNVVLLNDISLVIPPRKFVALVGGSGAGKSTLMDALNGLRPAQKGTVLYNGQDYYHNLSAFSTQLGYVPQDDIVHRELTVERALYYAAKMRLPSDFTKEQINQRINEVLDDVEMSERRKLLVNKLSGGQRKRVSIALELLANPSVFFLDEPTSGLDPGLDRKMMFLLRRLADRGRTIILVTHATNNINACDYVCFLCQGGRLAYFGPPNEAKTYFNKTDFAEIYSSLEPSKENPNVPSEAEARFKSSPEYYKYVVAAVNEGHAKRANGQGVQNEVKRARGGNPLKQFIIMSMRYIELLKNDPGNLAILLLQAPIIALLLVGMVRFEIGTGVFNEDKIVQCRTQILTKKGPLALPEANTKETVGCQKVKDFLKNDPRGIDFVKQKDNDADEALQEFITPALGSDAQTLLFVMAFGTVLFGCINGSREIVKESHIYRRERAVNLGIIPYMFSKIVVLGVLCFFQSGVLLLIINLGEPLVFSAFLPVLLEVYITLVLTSLAGLMIGLTISALSPNNDRAVSFVPIILIPQVIFSGSIIPFKDKFMQVVSFFFPTRWAMAALGSSAGLHGDKINGDKLFGDDYTYHGHVFSIFSQAESTQRILLAWGALAAFVIILTIVVGFCLKSKDVKV